MNSVYKSSAPQEQDDSHNAWHTLKIFIEPAITSVNKIRFPSAAKGYHSTTNLGNGRYKIISYVEADNPQGERRKIPFTAIIIKKPKGWEMESLDIQKAIKLSKPKPIRTPTNNTNNCTDGCLIICNQTNSCSNQRWIQECVYSCTH